MSATDPTAGCLPACDPPCLESPCTCGGKDGIDIGGEAVCQYDPDIKSGAVEYNSGLLDSREQHWADGSEPGMGVALQYTGGSTRGGCDPIKRSTDIIVHCDPCNQANISFVDEPSKCHYRVNITSIAGCPTNKPPPAGNCPHLCDQSTLQCRPVAAGTPGANGTLNVQRRRVKLLAAVGHRLTSSSEDLSRRSRRHMSLRKTAPACASSTSRQIRPLRRLKSLLNQYLLRKTSTMV